MKTLKALKITSVFQILYCLYCFVPILFLAIGDHTGIFKYTDIGIVLFCFSVINPTAIVSFFINISFFAERRKPEQKKLIGKTWVWIVVWPFIAICLFIVSGLLFIQYTGGA